MLHVDSSQGHRTDSNTGHLTIAMVSFKVTFVLFWCSDQRNQVVAWIGIWTVLYKPKINHRKLNPKKV